MTEQTQIAVNDKLVCIDATNQRIDLADTPDGLLLRGQVYCVSGMTECGGVRLTGLRAISARTGKEVGFDASRFCPLEQFREKFPEGVSSNPADENDLSYLGDDTAKRRQIELPEIEGVEEPKPLVLRVIEVLEMLHAEHHDPEMSPPWVSSGFMADQSAEAVQTELRALLKSPELAPAMNQSWTFWHFLLRRQNSTLLVCRNRSPVANLLFQMCMFGGNILTEQFLAGNFQESDLAVLTSAAGRLSNAPIRICDARNPGSFIEVLSAAHKSFEYVLCDWTLDGEELAAAYRLTRDSDITFLCPQ